MGLAEKGEALETICLGFSSALDALPQDTLMGKLGNLGVMRQKVGTNPHRCAVTNSLLSTRKAF